MIRRFDIEEAKAILNVVLNGYDIVDDEGLIWTKSKFAEKHADTIVSLSEKLLGPATLKELSIDTALKHRYVDKLTRGLFKIRKSKQRRGRRLN